MRSISAVLAVATMVVGLVLVVYGCGAGPFSDDRDGRDHPVREFDELRALMAKERPLHGIREREALEGDIRAFVLWSDHRSEPPDDVVVLLHGWAGLFTAPEAYGDWISHLAEQGRSILFPVYLPADWDPAKAAGNVLHGVAAGLDALGTEPQTLVVVGHTTGGALAFDYAAGAAESGLPRPDAIYAIYPARNPGGWIPPIDPTGIAPRTRIAVLSGEANPVVGGDEQARRLLRTAARVPREHRSYMEAEPDAEPIPVESDPVSQETYWRPLDRLIEQVRGNSRRAVARQG